MATNKILYIIVNTLFKKAIISDFRIYDSEIYFTVTPEFNSRELITNFILSSKLECNWNLQYGEFKPLGTCWNLLVSYKL